MSGYGDQTVKFYLLGDSIAWTIIINHFPVVTFIIFFLIYSEMFLKITMCNNQHVALCQQQQLRVFVVLITLAHISHTFQNTTWSIFWLHFST